MKKIFLTTLLMGSTLFGASYYNPNNSINAVALCSANVANAHGADSAYYNPANMVYNDNVNEVEIAATYVLLTPIHYDSVDNQNHIESTRYDTVIPSLHYVSKIVGNNVRIGFNIISPAGLSRQWNDFPAAPTAQEFSLQTIEFNPTVAFVITKNLSFGVGFRYIKADADAKLDGSMLGVSAYTVSMNGKDEAAGYNLALSYNYQNRFHLSATYRSKILFTLQGNADVIVGGTPISSDVSLAMPIPANLILASSYTFDSATTVELTYDRVMWSVVQETNFEYDNQLLESLFGVSQEKKWHDTVSYRLGVTQKLNKFVLMAGFAYGTNAADDAYVSFASPESDAYALSCGARYQATPSLNFGLAFLYNENKSRTVLQSDDPFGVNGTLSNKKAYLLSLGANIRF
jgi:long-chain fatty acid transport protein